VTVIVRMAVTMLVVVVVVVVVVAGVWEWLGPLRQHKVTVWAAVGMAMDVAPMPVKDDARTVHERVPPASASRGVLTIAAAADSK